MRSILLKPSLCLLSLLYTTCLFGEVGYVQPWGKDANITHYSKHPLTENTKNPNLWVKIASGVIAFHQNVLSPIDGPRSHYRPSSSQYMLQAMQKHGFAQGFIMGCDRLLRENKDPWCYRKTVYEGQLFKWDPVD